jgi:hypothetical protein
MAAILHLRAEERIPKTEDYVLVRRSSRGTWAISTWCAGTHANVPASDGVLADDFDGMISLARRWAASREVAVVYVQGAI